MISNFNLISYIMYVFNSKSEGNYKLKTIVLNIHEVCSNILINNEPITDSSRKRHRCI